MWAHTLPAKVRAYTRRKHNDGWILVAGAAAGHDLGQSRWLNGTANSDAIVDRTSTHASAMIVGNAPQSEHRQFDAARVCGSLACGSRLFNNDDDFVIGQLRDREMKRSNVHTHTHTQTLHDVYEHRGASSPPPPPSPTTTTAAAPAGTHTNAIVCAF